MWSAWQMLLPGGFLQAEEVLGLARVSHRANQLVAAPGSWPRHVEFQRKRLCSAMVKRLTSTTFTQKSLGLTMRYAQDAELHALRGARITKLTLLWSSDITDSSLLHLSGLPLTTLDLCRCSDVGLAHLRGFPLVRLDLSFCNEITDAGLEHLRDLPLTSLNLNGC